MAISSQTARVQYTLSGPGQTLSVPFPFLDAADLQVISTNPGTLLDTTLGLNTGYTVSGAGSSSGGSITLSAGASGDIITIARGGQLVQPAPFAYNAQFPASTVEKAADRLTMLVQQLQLLLKRALRLPVSAAEQGEVGGSSRSDKLIGFDSSGNVNLDVSRSQVQRIIIANPVAALTSVTDYGSTGDSTTAIVDYGATA